MKKIIFKGCGTALATPFTKDNKINYEVFKQMIENQIKNKVDALIVCGTTGESATMTDIERKECIKFVVDLVNKRIPVIAGTGSNNTAASIELTKYAKEIGCTAALIVTPYYNKTTQQGLITHYKTIASNTNLPIILYNVPSRTGVNINPETCLELSKIENIVAIKEASGNISQISKIRYLCKDNLNIYSGNDDQIIPILSIGGIGVISVLSNLVPNFVHQLCTFYFNGYTKEAAEMQITTLPLINALFYEVNPIPVKYALNLIGYDFGIPRLPLIELSSKNKALLKNELQKVTGLSV